MAGGWRAVKRFVAARGAAAAGLRGGPACADQYVGQSEEGVELVLVFSQSAIARFAISEEILHDVEGVFDERADNVRDISHIFGRLAGNG